MSRKSVHVLTVINSASNITTEVIDGDEHIIVRDIVPIVDDIVMNGGLYPAAEINKSYKSLEGKAMPFGHPKVDGKHVSANNPRAINQFNVGAWSKNVRKDGDKVKMDMYVNKRVAMSSKHGPDVIAALEALRDGKSTDPIHVSTGLDTMRVNSSGTSRGKRHNWIATNQVFDHTAILLYESGAGTPEEGVGIFVNAEGEEQEIETVNLADSDIPDHQDPALKQFFNQFMAFFSANNKHAKEETNPMKELITNALKAKGKEVEGKTEAELMDAYNQMVAEDAKAKADAEEKAKKEKEEADKKAKDTATNSEQAPAWFKPFADDLAAVKSGLTANADQERSSMRSAVKAKFNMTDLAVNALDGEPLKELYAQCQTSTGLSGAFRQVNSNQSFSEMPE